MVAEEKRRVAKRLSAAFVRGAGAGFWPDGDGLYLRVDGKGNRRWVFVSQIGRKRREMGLGPVRTVGLAEARVAAHEARKAFLAGRNPIVERQDSQASRNRACDLRSGRKCLPGGEGSRLAQRQALQSGADDA
jgi:Arm domain-containing DNA-binding protein